MFSAHTILRSLPIVVALALAGAPALAGDRPRAPSPAQGAEGDGWQNQTFPMPADQFRRHVERRIEKARQHMEELMTRANVPEAKRAEIRRAAEAGAARVRGATTRVTADGKVTKEEAREVRELARDIVKDLRQRYGKGHGRGRGK